MLALRDSWVDFRHAWVTLDGPDVEHLLESEQVIYGHGPTNRSILNLFRNLWLAWRVLGEQRPDAVLSTGAGLAVPFIILARLRGCRTIYVESVTRSSSLSLSGRLVYPFANDFFVQWPEATKLRRATYRGAVL